MGFFSKLVMLRFVLKGGLNVSKTKAIIIASNLKGDFGPGFEDVGNILAHASHIEKAGAVLWSIVIPGGRTADFFPYSDINTGYFYSVADKNVTHIFDIEYIKGANQFKEKRGIYKFLIESRKPGWKHSRNSFYWMMITGIYRLKRKHPLRDFIKLKDRQPLILCRNYSIAWDPKFRHDNEKVTRREIMSDYIGQLLCVGKATESDIEELFSYRLADNLSLVERQGSFKNAGRIDLLYKNRLGKYILYEIKKGTARFAALEQTKRYMSYAKKKYKIGAADIAGVVLAQSIEPELALALTKEPNLKGKKYFFSINIK